MSVCECMCVCECNNKIGMNTLRRRNPLSASWDDMRGVFAPMQEGAVQMLCSVFVQRATVCRSSVCACVCERLSWGGIVHGTRARVFVWGGVVLRVKSSCSAKMQIAHSLDEYMLVFMSSAGGRARAVLCRAICCAGGDWRREWSTSDSVETRWCGRLYDHVRQPSSCLSWHCEKYMQLKCVRLLHSFQMQSTIDQTKTKQKTNLKLKTKRNDLIVFVLNKQPKRCFSTIFGVKQASGIRKLIQLVMAAPHVLRNYIHMQRTANMLACRMIFNLERIFSKGGEWCRFGFRWIEGEGRAHCILDTLNIWMSAGLCGGKTKT